MITPGSGAAMASNSELARQIAELDRRIKNMQRHGVIAQIDHARVRVRVRDGDWLSHWLPWVERRASSEASWSPPQLGERVIVLAPAGDLEQALVMTGLPCRDNPVPSNEPKRSVRRFDPGHVFELQVGNTKIEITSGEIAITTRRMSVNGKNVATVTDEIDVRRGSSRGRWEIVTGVGS